MNRAKYGVLQVFLIQFSVFVFPSAWYTSQHTLNLIRCYAVAGFNKFSFPDPIHVIFAGASLLRHSLDVCAVDGVESFFLLAGGHRKCSTNAPNSLRELLFFHG